MLRVVYCLYPFWVGDESVEDPDNHKCNFVHVDENADINNEILEIFEMLILDANAKAADHHEELLEQCHCKWKLLPKFCFFHPEGDPDNDKDSLDVVQDVLSQLVPGKKGDKLSIAQILHDILQEFVS